MQSKKAKNDAAVKVVNLRQRLNQESTARTYAQMELDDMSRKLVDKSAEVIIDFQKHLINNRISSGSSCQGYGECITWSTAERYGILKPIFARTTVDDHEASTLSEQPSSITIVTSSQT
jgi:hypothetical protein